MGISYASSAGLATGIMEGGGPSSETGPAAGLAQSGHGSVRRTELPWGPMDLNGVRAGKVVMAGRGRKGGCDEGDGVTVDERTHRRVRTIPLDVAEPAEIRGRVRAYLTVLGFEASRAEAWAQQACEGATGGGEAFARLRAMFVAELAARAPHVADDPECAALARLSVWLQAEPARLATLPLTPPLTRQPMASERARS